MMHPDFWGLGKLHLAPKDEALWIFLLGVTEEQLLQLALMADANDEAMIFVRFNDSETYDAAELESEAIAFTERVSYLFQNGNCFDLGYTGFMCDVLSKPMAFFVGGDAVTIGGPGHPSEAIKIKTLARMQNWMKVSQTVVRAEFGNFEIKAAMSLFRYKDKADNRSHVDTTSQNIKRLARFFSIPEDALKEQFHYVYPIFANI
eukprot:7410939-Pyramimonas_sp.AAC.1